MSGNIIKTLTCKEFCNLYKECPIPTNRYKSCKYCRTCEAWFLRIRCGIKCACCGMILVNRARNKKIYYDEKEKKWV
jgi:hypothetical protein